MLKIRIIIPAFNEENGVGQVIQEIPKRVVDEIIVVNNASTDKTEIIARDNGATVLHEAIPGYGRACLTGIEYIKHSASKPDVIVFLEADHSDIAITGGNTSHWLFRTAPIPKKPHEIMCASSPLLLE